MLSCGSASCWAQTFFTHTLNINNWPTFTAAFKTDTINNFHFGVISKDNNQTRFTLFGTNGSLTLEVSTSAGSYSMPGLTTSLSPNTWYYGQVSFPLPNVGEMYLWPVGQPRPSTPTIAYAGLYMIDPGLNFWQYGNNGVGLVHTWIGNVQMTSKDTNSQTTGYGINAMQLSSDGTTYGCPTYSSVAPFSGGPWCVYSTQSFPWTLTTGDGKKTLYYQYVDNAGNVGSGSSQIIYDTTPPVVNSLSPGNGSEVRGIVTVDTNAT